MKANILILAGLMIGNGAISAMGQVFMNTVKNESPVAVKVTSTWHASGFEMPGFKKIDKDNDLTTVIQPGKQASLQLSGGGCFRTTCSSLSKLTIEEAPSISGLAVKTLPLEITNPGYDINYRNKVFVVSTAKSAAENKNGQQFTFEVQQ